MDQQRAALVQIAIHGRMLLTHVAPSTLLTTQALEQAVALVAIPPWPQLSHAQVTPLDTTFLPVQFCRLVVMARIRTHRQQVFVYLAPTELLQITCR